MLQWRAFPAPSHPSLVVITRLLKDTQTDSTLLVFDVPGACLSRCHVAVPVLVPVHISLVFCVVFVCKSNLIVLSTSLFCRCSIGLPCLFVASDFSLIVHLAVFNCFMFILCYPGSLLPEPFGFYFFGFALLCK